MKPEAEQARKRFTLSGRVQGVGFRPFVYRLAHEFSLSGFVRNSPEGVVVEAQGGPDDLDAFGQALLRRLPPLARVSACRVEDLPPEAVPCAAGQAASTEQVFNISGSGSGPAHAVLISPDVTTCPDCLAEMQEAANRRFHYPFINCTNCGPRYSITANMPYDRPFTTMACFPLCPACAAEYANPLDRRFHAQPNACPVCGPRLWFVKAGEASAPPLSPASIVPAAFSASPVAPPRSDSPSSAASAASPAQSSPEQAANAGNATAIRAAAQALLAGKIVAVKGLGGFHLACDANNPAALRELRRRKNRPHKPLAVMVPDIASAELLARPGPAEKALLASLERPIVLCPLPAPEEATRLNTLNLLAPDNSCLGLMLPYTPLHHLLLAEFAALLKEARAAGGATGVNSAADALPGPELSGMGPEIEPESGAEMGPNIGTGAGPGVLPALVMTSGNRGGEPIALGNREAVEALAGIADAFLLHDRDILIRVDDSVVRALPEGLCAASGTPGLAAQACGFAVASAGLGGVTPDLPELAEQAVLPEAAGLAAERLFLRRSRGFVPAPLPLPPLQTPTLPGEDSETGHTAPVTPSSIRPAPVTAAPLNFVPVNFIPLNFAPVNSVPVKPVQTKPSPAILALGAELKNTICCIRGAEAFVSQHIGDVSNVETAAFQRELAEHLPKILQVAPQAIVCDAHPDFMGTELARELSKALAPGGEGALPLLRAQHHLAHAHAVLAENRHFAPALVLTLDGSGFAPDGTVWGGELLLVDGPARSWNRLGALRGLDLPGGESAIRQPWRLAHALLFRLGLLEDARENARQGGRPLPWLAGPSALAQDVAAAELLPQMLLKGVNSPKSSSCGRLFDAASALLGLCLRTSYEGQAAIRLEEAQGLPWNGVPEVSPGSRWACPVLPLSDLFGLEHAPEAPGPYAPQFILDTHALFRALYAEWKDEAPNALLARKFHASLAAGLVELALRGAEQSGVKIVGLSGGVMQNATLLQLLCSGLRGCGLTPLIHLALPPGDACIAYGQAVWASFELGGLKPGANALP